MDPFYNDSGPRDDEPLKILFVGEFKYGHFQAIRKHSNIINRPNLNN